MKNVKFRILKSFLIYIKKIYRKAYLEISRCDIKCPECNIWYSESLITGKNELNDTDVGYSFKCGQCKKTSYWNTVAFPFPARCKENGDIIDE